MNAIEHGEMPEPRWRHPLVDPRLIIALAALILGQFVTGLIFLGGLNTRVGSIEKHHDKLEEFLLSTGPALADMKARLITIEEFNRERLRLVEALQREHTQLLREHVTDYHNYRTNRPNGELPR